MKKGKSIFLLGLLIIMTLVLALNNVVWAEVTTITSDLNGHYNLADFEEISGKKLQEFNESPMLNERVQSGELPPVAERLPDNPLVEIPLMNVGQYGGTLRWAEFSTTFDVTLRHINRAKFLDRPPSSTYFYNSGYDGPTDPGIFSEWKVEDEGKVFTFKIREGLKWSDGVPVTTEDVEYCFEDVLKNKEIFPTLPDWIRWGDELTKLEIIDDNTFKLIFSESFGSFIERQFRGDLGRGMWTNLIRPKHYVKQFHKKYTDWDELLPKMKELEFEEKEEWGTFYSAVDYGATADGGNIIGLPNPIEYPTLNPYIVTEVKEEGHWHFERNPYFYMVDTEGNQLPYIDKLNRRYVSNKEMINMDIIQGNLDVMGQLLQLSDYPLFKRNEDKGGYKVMPLPAYQHQMLLYIFNLEVDNEIFPKEIIKDLRFRQALSLALDREQIKESLFLGFGKSAQLAPSSGKDVYEEGMEEAFAQYDPERAKNLLDEMGIKDNDGNGWREWNGEDLTIPFMYYEVTPTATPGAEMAKRYWENIGLKVDVKQVDGGLFWQRQGANKVAFTDWWLGGEYHIPYGVWTFQVNVPMWEQWQNTNGENGIEPPLWAKKVYELKEQALSLPSLEEREKAAKEIWKMQTEKLWILGTVAGTPLPFVYNEKLGNISIAEERGYPNTVLMEIMPQWYFEE